MIICKVIGSIWATRKEESLNGIKLMIVRQENNESQDSFVAADFVGAGIGERVIVAMGSSARNACIDPNAPIDATIVGIVDELEIQENN